MLPLANFLFITVHQRNLEGNVFRRVCLSLYRGEAVLVQGPSPTPHVQGTGSDLVPGMFKHVNYVVCTVGKRAVGIRLKCLLVLFTNIFLVT